MGKAATLWRPELIIFTFAVACTAAVASLQSKLNDPSSRLLQHSAPGGMVNVRMETWPWPRIDHFIASDADVAVLDIDFSSPLRGTFGPDAVKETRAVIGAATVEEMR